MVVLDASAVLAWLQGEPGAEEVQTLVDDPDLDPVCGAANWSEVAQKTMSRDSWDEARALLLAHGVRVAPVEAADAEQAAATWTRGQGLSLADRLCLALGSRLDAAVWTTDRAWGDVNPVRQLR